MYRKQILELIEKCREAEGSGLSLNDIRFDILPEIMNPLLESPADFLRWVQEDRAYSYYFFEVQARGVCAKPKEAAALILEAMVVDAME